MGDNEYCITPEYPYCPVCQFGGIDTSNCETYEDAQDAPWVCRCTKRDYDEYMNKHRYEPTDEGEWE